MTSRILRSIFLSIFFCILFTPVNDALFAEDDQNLDAQLAASMRELKSLSKEMNKANSEYNTAVGEMNDQADSRVMIQLTYPLGKSPKVFTEGWTFGVQAMSIPMMENGDMEPRDLSSEVEWEGSGSFNPEQGSQSHPAFSAEGDNTIILSVMIDGKKITKTCHVNAVSPAKYARVGSRADCSADFHHCPSCPHKVFGFVETGSPHVMINGKPAAREGDTGTHFAPCCGLNTFAISRGDSEVLIDGRPAAKIDSGYGQTKHCGGMGALTKA